MNDIRCDYQTIKGGVKATEQWVSVSKGNQRGIPFYEAKGFILNHERDGHGSVAEEFYISSRHCRKI